MSRTVAHYMQHRLKKRHIEYTPRMEKPPACKHVRWVEHASRGLRLAGYADELNPSIRHKGWYQNDEGDDYCGVLRGVVYRLPHGRFAYGYADPNNEDCALLCFDNDAECEQEAARYADRVAELAAEQEREYQRKWRAAERARCLRALIAATREEHSALIAGIREGVGDDAIGARTRERVRAAARDAVKEYRALLEDHGNEILSNQYN